MQIYTVYQFLKLNFRNSNPHHRRTQDFGLGGGGRPEGTQNLKLNVAKNIGKFDEKMSRFFILKQAYL